VMIMGGGSVYALLLIAGLDLHYHVTLMIGHTPWEVAKMLRHPETADSHIEALICSRIIPTVSKLREILPLSLGSFFCRDFIESTAVGD
ncbi:hypothetical protein DFH29DRAFT_769070, partial [Suillus ampliporus]